MFDSQDTFIKNISEFLSKNGVLKTVQYVHTTQGQRLLQCAWEILLELTGVKVFRAIGMKGGKKFLRTRIASTTNQDLRDKDSNNFRTPTNFKYSLLLPISTPIG